MGTASMDKITAPNALSASRLLLAPLCFLLIADTAWLLAACVLLTAVATDMLDGWLARARNEVTPLGGLLDHGSDAVFVTVVLTALAIAGDIPAFLPPLVIIAFTQYMLDSRALAGHPLRTSLIGRNNGIAYFVLAGFPLCQRALGITVVPDDAFYWAGWVLIATTLLSMADRALALLRQPPSK